MSEKRELTHSEVFELTVKMATILTRLGVTGSKIYGVPRGGVPVVYLLKSILPGITIVSQPGDADVIVDDIIDSGKTMVRYACLGVPFLALIDKRDDEEWVGVWVIFPWETSMRSISVDGDETADTSADDITTRFLQVIGEDAARDGLVETPARVVASWKHLYGGYDVDATTLLKSFDNTESQYDEMVVLRDIEFYSTCEHHLLPFFGRIHIGYLPVDRVVGVSKLARVVEAYSRRLQIQERLTQQIAEVIQSELHPLGVGVYCEAQHLCMLARGVQKQNSVMCTTSLTGRFRDTATRAEFLSTVKGGR